MHSQPHPGARPRHAGPSQVPRPLSRYAPSPTTPESPAGARACVFPANAGFTISERLAALSSVTRLNRVRFRYGSHRPPHRCFRAPVARFTPPMRLHVSQAFHMVNSFQFTREVRLRLTHQQVQMNCGHEILPLPRFVVGTAGANPRRTPADAVQAPPTPGCGRPRTTGVRAGWTPMSGVCREGNRRKERRPWGSRRQAGLAGGGGRERAPPPGDGSGRSPAPRPAAPAPAGSA